MDKKTELKIRRLTSNQAKALRAIISIPGTAISNPTASGVYISDRTGLQGNSLGGTVSALERNGIIQPLGREERQFNWELRDPDFVKSAASEPEVLIELLDKVAKDKK